MPSVETMLQLQKEKQQTNLPDKLEQLKARIKYTDDKINKLVYGLYGLSEEEIGIAQGKWFRLCEEARRSNLKVM